MRLIVGLGNPGRQYLLSRHNVGFWCVEHLATLWDIPLSERRARVIVGEGMVDGEQVVLAKPRTFVNRSGEGILYLLDRFHATASNLLIICDDMDLPLGRIRIRRGGSAGGHNGLMSIIEATSTQQFPRLRVGIGRPEEGVDEVSFVLGRFKLMEKRSIEQAVALVGEATLSLLQEGLESAMNRFNADSK